MSMPTVNIKWRGFNPFNDRHARFLGEWRQKQRETMERFNKGRVEKLLERAREKVESAVGKLKTTQEKHFQTHLMPSDVSLTESHLSWAAKRAAEFGFTKNRMLYHTAVLVLARVKRASEWHENPESLKVFEREFAKRAEAIPRRRAIERMQLLWDVAAWYRSGMVFTLVDQPYKHYQTEKLEDPTRLPNTRSLFSMGALHNFPEEQTVVEANIKLLKPLRIEGDAMPPDAWTSYPGLDIQLLKNEAIKAQKQAEKARRRKTA